MGVWVLKDISIPLCDCLSNSFQFEACLPRLLLYWPWPAVAKPPSLLGPLSLACLVLLVFGLHRVSPNYSSIFSWSGIPFSLVLLFTICLSFRWYLANKFVELFEDTYKSLDVSWDVSLVVLQVSGPYKSCWLDICINRFANQFWPPYWRCTG